MLRSILSALISACVLGLAASCRPAQIRPTPAASLPNPASLHCTLDGGTLVLRQDALGSVTGICIFRDGSECDEWSYFREQCRPGQSLLVALATGIPSASVRPTQPPAAGAPAMDAGPWALYQNADAGYSFRHPANATVTPIGDPLNGVSISGPLAANERWPQIIISHPRGRDDYQPPDGADLLQWLTDHQLIGDTRMPDVQIAGLRAVHLRHDRSPQSFAYDRYFFARSGQLYMLVIGHTGDREDWPLYQRFLDSISFDPRP